MHWNRNQKNQLKTEGERRGQKIQNTKAICMINDYHRITFLQSHITHPSIKQIKLITNHILPSSPLTILCHTSILWQWKIIYSEW